MLSLTTNPVAGLFRRTKRRFTRGGLGSSRKSIAQKIWDGEPAPSVVSSSEASAERESAYSRLKSETKY
ncbi:hypothetical protein MLD52_13475 [Puniceicoccaceae bacterium K14]|nr:hypothetical protein [Puniceicoccaceae bacterium K14]